MRSESDADMQSAILPMRRVGSPLPSISRQVSPPSRVTWMPLAGPPLSRFQVLRSRSHMLAMIFRGLAGSITIS